MIRDCTYPRTSTANVTTGGSGRSKGSRLVICIQRWAPDPSFAPRISPRKGGRLAPDGIFVDHRLHDRGLNFCGGQPLNSVTMLDGFGGHVTATSPLMRSPLDARSYLRCTRPFHELPDNRKNREHYIQIRHADRNNHEDRDPLAGPGDKQNQQDMKRRDYSHRDPKPNMSPQLPPHCYGDA